jgi:peptidoglycan/LPS O-acetylase OafA/YrhL
MAVTATLTAILLSYLVYSFAERPIQRLLKPRRPAQTPTAPAVQVEKASVP